MSNATVYHVCNPCKVALIYGDLTACDQYDEATADELRTLIETFSELGHVIDAGTVPNSGVFDCECCREHVYGSKECVETVN